MHGARVEDEVAGVGLEEPGRDVEDLVANLARRLEGRRQRDGRAAAREAADAEGHPGAVAVNDRDVIGGHRELLGDDLGERGLDPLPDRGDAGVDDDAARAVDLDASVFPRTEPGLFQDAAKADPEIASLAPGPRLLGAHGLVIRRRERLLERGAIVAAVVDGLLAQR